MENLILHFVPLATVQKFIKIALNVDHSTRKYRNRQTQVILPFVPCHATEMRQIKRHNIHRRTYSYG